MASSAYYCPLHCYTHAEDYMLVKACAYLATPSKAIRELIDNCLCQDKRNQPVTGGDTWLQSSGACAMHMPCCAML